MNQQPSMLAEVRELSSRYYNREMTFSEYREMRNQLLDKINARYNGATKPALSSDQLFNF